MRPLCVPLLKRLSRTGGLSPSVLSPFIIRPEMEEATVSHGYLLLLLACLGNFIPSARSKILPGPL